MAILQFWKIAEPLKKIAGVANRVRWEAVGTSLTSKKTARRQRSAEIDGNSKKHDRAGSRQWRWRHLSDTSAVRRGGRGAAAGGPDSYYYYRLARAAAASVRARSVRILVTTGPPTRLPTGNRGGHYRGNRGDGHSSDRRAPGPSGSGTRRSRSPLATRSRPCFLPGRRRIDPTALAITTTMIKMGTRIVITTVYDNNNMNAVGAARDLTEFGGLLAILIYIVQ